LSDKATRKLILHEIELRSQTIRDSLTGLYNRRFLDNGLDVYLNELSESKETLSVLMVDVDFFKDFNDTYGHDAGDKCLKSIADMLDSSIRADDGFTARYGGEEFIMALPRTDQKGAQIVADRLLNHMRSLNIPHENSNIAKIVTISIGFTSGVSDGTRKPEDFTKKADEALYTSKRNGRNRSTYLNLKEDEKC
jgi:diguanylate cyclase (GGDEF)-like protein